MQGPDWNDLRAFLAIARAGQLVRAARSIGVDATTMGRRLRRLERALGQTLFEQTREGQVLTEAGERLLTTVETMQTATDRLLVQSSNAGRLTGLLRVSVSEGFGAHFVARHLASFTDLHPELTVDLVANSGFLSPSKRETDIAVLLARPRSGQVVASKLTDYALQLYAAPDYLERAGTPETAADLRSRRLVGYVPDLLYAPELRYLFEIDERLTPTIRSSSINAQHGVLASGNGIGILPCFIGDADRSLVKVLPDIRILRSFWVVTHQDTQRLKRVRAFRSWLGDIAQRHRGILLGDGSDAQTPISVSD